MNPTIPTLTAEQREEALNKARMARKKRARILAEFAAGDMTLPEVLDLRDDPVIGRIKVKNLIERIPTIGPARSTKLLRELGIAENRRIHGLGTKQIARLTDWYDYRVSEGKADAD